jgi:DNA (cytosine-5)-methyltransferase 1
MYKNMYKNNNYSIKDLKKLCKEHNIIGYSNKKKIELIELLNNSVKEDSVENSVEDSVEDNVKEDSFIKENVKEDSINNNIKTKNLKFIDLFCGIGGFHQAMNRFNSKCVFACDIDEKCRQIYEKNYGIKPEGDITKICIENIPSFDILCGGFPCQSFSNSGKKKGLNDDRGNLFENILNIAIEKKPLFLFLENVKHIKKIDNGNVFKHIIQRINDSGYVVNNETIFELSPHQLGIPQQRERVIFVCIRKDFYDIDKKIIINPPTIPIQLNSIIETDKNITDKYKISKETEEILNVWDEMIHEFEENEILSPTILCNEFYKIYSEEEFKQLPLWKQDYIIKNKPLYEKYKEKWDSWYSKHQTILQKKEIFGKLEWQTGKKKSNDSIFNYFIQLRQSGIRVKKENYFPTLVAIVQTPIYGKEKRYITPRECARLQSFPDTFIIHDNDHIAYKQFGNAVNVDVVHYIIKNTLLTYEFL